VENEWCDFPENVNCERFSTTAPPPPSCDDWLICPRNGFGFLPNFNICHRYFECIFSVRHLRTCAEGTTFDVISLSCKSPELALCVIDAECIE
jgi:Chitin binding Peritrophin-A domain